MMVGFLIGSLVFNFIMLFLYYEAWIGWGKALKLAKEILDSEIDNSDAILKIVQSCKSAMEAIATENENLKKELDTLRESGYNTERNEQQTLENGELK
jgi:hypothetical protein